MISPRYALFLSEQYYPSGVLKDLFALTGTLEQCITILFVKQCLAEVHRYHDFDWWHIVDLQTGQVVHSSDDED